MIYTIIYRKKNILFLLGLILILIPTSSFAQKKYFKQGLKEGKTSTGFYKAYITKKKIYSTDEIKAYATKHDYIVTDFSYKRIQRFGGSKKGVRSFYFLPKKEANEYVFNKLISTIKGNKTDYNWLIKKPKGSGYIFIPNKNKTILLT